MSSNEPADLVPLDDLAQAAECLRAIAHPVRLRIIDILLHGSFPVHQIAEWCELPPAQTCEHLRLLKGHGHLDAERHGREVHYRICNPRLPKLLACIRSHSACGSSLPSPSSQES